jgi:ABC-type amino acid transport substrate-binding protein
LDFKVAVKEGTVAELILKTLGKEKYIVKVSTDEVALDLLNSKSKGIKAIFGDSITLRYLTRKKSDTYLFHTTMKWLTGSTNILK